jgi:hypothetical protein
VIFVFFVADLSVFVIFVFFVAQKLHVLRGDSHNKSLTDLDLPGSGAMWHTDC